MGRRHGPGRRRRRRRAPRPPGGAQGRGRGHHPLARRTRSWRRGAGVRPRPTGARPRAHAPLRGRMAVELRPPVPVDKGTTVAELVDAARRSPVFAGDDAGDLPAFAALARLADDRRARARGERSGWRRTRARPRSSPPTWWSTARGAGDAARRARRRDQRGVAEQLVEPGAAACAPRRARAAARRVGARSSSGIDSAGCSACALCSTSYGWTASTASCSSS